jgi:gamma-glutamyltranspeptidase / glutathione hydrolase
MTREGEDQLPMSVPGTASLPGIEAPRRGPVYGTRLAVAADHPLASFVAMTIFQRGGNAVDAAIAAAAVNVVTKPHRTHLGGDAFALVWHRESGDVDCLNAGGRAPLDVRLERFRQGIPARGPLASTVPGIVDSWSELQGRYGSLPLRELLAPAVQLADHGFPVSFRLSEAMKLIATPETPEALKRAYLKNGDSPYEPGDTLRLPEVAAALSRIAEEGREGFYGGETGNLLAAAMKESGGLIGPEDLEMPTAHWHEPLVTPYRGHVVYEQALPSQGVILLEALNIVEQFPLAKWGAVSADSVHVMAEATKLAFADLRRHGADPLLEEVPLEMLLSKEHAKSRAAEIDLKHARAAAVQITPSDTTSFVVADEEMAVSYIQSIFSPWGSRFLIPGAGVLMNNRLRGFHLDAASPNRLAPGKRTVHTLNTFLVVKDGQLVVGGGTPGGDFQVQTNLQMIAGVVDWGLDLQSALDMPRWANLAGGRLAIEGRFTLDLHQELVSRGHTVQVVAGWEATLSRGQLIASNPAGGWAVASDLRGEGVALGL